MDKNMFCFQCEQTIGCSGCTGNSGVCGKTADTAKLQDELTGALIGLAKAVDSLHACRGIAAAQIIYQRIGAVIIADSDHRIQSRIHSLFTILAGNGVVLFVNSAHNIELDQTGGLHRTCIQAAF